MLTRAGWACTLVGMSTNTYNRRPAPSGSRYVKKSEAAGSRRRRAEAVRKLRRTRPEEAS